MHATSLTLDFKEKWVSLMTKALTPTEYSKKQNDNTNRNQKPRLQNDCGPTWVAVGTSNNRLKSGAAIVENQGLSNDSHPTGVVIR